MRELDHHWFHKLMSRSKKCEVNASWALLLIYILLFLFFILVWLFGKKGIYKSIVDYSSSAKWTSIAFEHPYPDAITMEVMPTRQLSNRLSIIVLLQTKTTHGIPELAVNLDNRQPT